MDLSLTDEQRMLADSVRSVFAQADGDPTSGADAPEGSLAFRREVWQQAAELGVTALVTPEEYDGAGAGVGEAYAAANVMGALAVPEPLTDVAYVPSWLLQDLGTDDQKQDWLPRLAAGEALVPLAHAESGAGWGRERSTTVTAGRIRGGKRAVAVPADADAFLVTAVEDGTPGVYLVTAGEGVTVEPHRDAEWVASGTVTFDGAAAERLGGGDGVAASDALRRAVALARIVQGGRAVGLMDTALTQTVEYLKVRKQFGVTLNRFQALTHRAAQLYSDVELARSTALWATGIAESEDVSLDELESTALDAFVFLARQARVIAEEAVQLHGGIGVTYETAISHYAAALTSFQQIYGGVLEARSTGVSSSSPTTPPSALLDNELPSYS
ncbi:MAG: acyl-CoA dehydrogenase family protein [Mycobacteriaceae bacterium]